MTHDSIKLQLKLLQNNLFCYFLHKNAASCNIRVLTTILKHTGCLLLNILLTVYLYQCLVQLDSWFSKKMFVICFDRECSQMEIYISSLQTGIRMARGYVQCSKGYMGLDSFVRINFQINFLKEEKAWVRAPPFPIALHQLYIWGTNFLPIQNLLTENCARV